ncbi:sensor histidine kinase [Marinifilum flexuosum]|nr:ATP-binding protein [Marinifilum flexuosum]
MSKNRLNRKKFKIISPMVLSMFLLVTFVGYWLHSQYNNEKKNLQVELSRLYHVSINDGEFILFYRNVIKPALNHQDTINFESLKIGSPKTSSDFKKSYIKELKEFIDTNQNYTNIFRAIEASSFIPDSLRDERYYDILRLGYRYQIYPAQILYNQRKKSNDTTQQFLRNIFLRNVAINFPNIKAGHEDEIDRENIELIEKTNHEVLRRGKLGIIIYTRRYDKASVLYFEHYFLHLITEILPQIIFGIVLISLSVFALVVAYRSYLSQAKLNMLRSDFVSNITHELKIPVSTAKAAMEAILNYGISDDKEKTKSYLKMVASEMNRLDSLTSRVLEHSKLESNQHLLKKEETNLNEFVDRIVKSVQLFSANTINIKFTKPNELISIPIDQVYIEGVIRNLIENSKKYGGDDVSIIVNLWQKGLHVYISVIDNGPGIPKEYLNKVFDRFFRVPTGDQHNVKGFGLGLSFAALVMKQHNGSIGADNLTEHGCEIKLEFPA